ncbi:MAG: HEAT repeat domain-containing protein [Anaerolineales bacterium]|nr:HEAT repeat domain-containing protein [Anaerolineales bacterium]
MAKEEAPIEIEEVPFETIVAALLDEKTPFPARHLRRFSDLAPAELEAVRKTWPQVSLWRKVALLEDLGILLDTDTLVSFEALAQALLGDPEAPVRRLAVCLLHECENHRLVPALLDLLAQDDDPDVRAAAATALGEFVFLGELEKIPTEIHHRLEDSLLAVVGDGPSVLVRRRALEALGNSSRDEVPALIEAAYHEDDPLWKVSALYAMGRSGDERWSKQVLANLHNPREEIRLEAIEAAGELGLRSARTALFDLLADEEDPAARREIVWALSQIGGEGIRERLEELLELETDDEEAEFLAEALDNLALTDDIALFDLFDIDADEDDDTTE